LPRSSAVCPSSPAPNYKPMECGSGESVSKPTNGAGPRPLLFQYPISWGVAPGWYESAPLALQLLLGTSLKGRRPDFISA
jgi:hypothetical protein